MDEIFFENMNSKNDTIDAKDIINDAELIRKIFDLINNQDEYIEIEADKVLDLAGNWNGGYIYGDITKEDGCLVNIAGYMRCYNNTLVGLHSYITIIEHEQNFYYVISEKDGIYTCVKDKNTIGSAITQQLNNVDNYN